MARYIVRRLTWAVFTLWAICVLSFLVIQLPPGDFASSYVARLAENGTAPANVAQVRKNLGLDQSALLQYVHWLKGMLHGDFGLSLSTQQPVSHVIGSTFAYTALIALMSVAITWLLAVPLGVYSAVRRYS